MVIRSAIFNQDHEFKPTRNKFPGPHSVSAVTCLLYGYVLPYSPLFPKLPQFVPLPESASRPYGYARVRAHGSPTLTPGLIETRHRPVSNLGATWKVSEQFV